MKFLKLKIISASIFMATISPITIADTQTFTEAVSGGEASVVFRLRHESVSQDNPLKDAQALTLRSSLQYDTSSYKNFSATLQVEDVRIIAGLNDYSVPPTGFEPGVYSVIADPETTEVSQSFIQYKNSALDIKFGRQIINYDNQRFIGAVGWRQDGQVFDALTINVKANEKLKLAYNFIAQRNRIFADSADIDSKDHLFHGTYASPIGELVAYSYLLEVDQALNNSLDTFGLRLSGTRKLGKKSINTSYIAEFATQKSTTGSNSFDATYSIIEGGISFPLVTAKLGYEVLGSDSGDYGFATPLATVHAFNGWADIFLATPTQGLEDIYLKLSGKLFGGTLTAIAHDYSANKTSSTIRDLGHEFNLQFVRPVADHYTLGIKYANYNAGDLSAKPDTEKLALWFQASF